MSRRREREPPACVWVAPPPPDLECSVCSEVFTDPVTLACGHTFCRACAAAWFTSSAKRCPVARCAASAGSKPAVLPTNYALKGVVEALRVYCRFGVCEDEHGGWMLDSAGGCPVQLSRAEAAAHEAACEHALEACPFAGCGVLRRRRDADAHDAEMAVAHARGERDARLALEAIAHAHQARLDALETSLAAVVRAAAGDGAARAVTGATEGTQDDAPPNVKCPLTGKSMLDLKEPVRDQKGYVYEKAAVLQYIAGYNRGPAKNPNAGVTAPITAAEMQPAKNVMRMQRRRQLALQQNVQIDVDAE